MKKISKKLGYEIEISIHGMAQINNPAGLTMSNSLIVEFVGPPGVGKTTIADKVIELNKPESTELIKLENFATRLQRKYRKPKRLDRMYEWLLERKIRRIESRNFTPLVKIHQLNHASKVAIWDNYIHLRDDDKIILADDGFVYHFIDPLIDLGKEKPADFCKIMDNRIVVLCKDNPVNIVKRIRVRQKKGVLRERHWKLGNDELQLQTKLELEREERLIDVLKHNEVPFIDIDGNDSVTKNALIVSNFITTVSP